MSFVGPVAIWWIPRPRSPRISLRAAAASWAAAVPVLAATLLWLEALSLPLWPFGRAVSTLPEILLRYEMTLLVCLIYVTVCSLPGWWACRLAAKRDALAIDEAIRSECYERAALLLHRYSLLTSAVWRRLPPQAIAWDGMLRVHLGRHRRLYVYCRPREPLPSLPPDPGASFSPEVVPPPQPSLWWAIGLVPIMLLLYALLLDIQQRGNVPRVLHVNVVLLSVILLTYGGYFMLTLLGRSHHFRFAPGVVQLVKFALGRRRPIIETFNLRQVHTILDLSSKWPGLTLLNVDTGKRETLRLRSQPIVIDAVFRAVLSTAPSPPLSEEQLLE